LPRKACSATSSRKSNRDHGDLERRWSSSRRGSRAAWIARFLLTALFFTGAWTAQAQPVLHLSTDPDLVRVGRPFSLLVEIRWTGDPGKYVLYPPHLELEDGIARGAQTQTFATEGGETVYRYTFQLTATQPGTVAPGKVSVDYRDMTAQGDTPVRGTLEQAVPEVTVQPGGAGAVVARALPWGLGALILLVPFLWYRRRSRSPRASEPSPPPGPSAQDLLARARRALVDGDQETFLETLLALKPTLPSAQDPLPPADKLEAERLRVRYGGIQADSERLRRLLREVEVALGKGSGSG